MVHTAKASLILPYTGIEVGVTYEHVETLTNSGAGVTVVIGNLKFDDIESVPKIPLEDTILAQLFPKHSPRDSDVTRLTSIEWIPEENQYLVCEMISSYP